MSVGGGVCMSVGGGVCMSVGGGFIRVLVDIALHHLSGHGC